MILSGKKVNFLGDSITEGCGASSPEYGFVNTIKERYGLEVARNYGIGGTRITPNHSPSEEPIWDKDFCGRFSEMDDDADIVVVFGGTNDFGHGDAELGSAKDMGTETFYGACDYLFSGLSGKYPEAVIVVVTPCHREGEEDHHGDGRKAYGEVLEVYVDAIKKVAARYSLHVLDMFDYSVNPDAKRLTMNMLPDGLHPNDEGHSVIADLIAEYIGRI